MRMRKLPWAEEYVNNSPRNVLQPEQNAGQWRSLLKRDELHVEIGTGKGDYYIGMSKKFPDVAWIGVEKNINVAALALRKEEEDPQDNSLFICGDAMSIDKWFAKGEVDVIHLNFSDPWPKKRNSKRRLSHGNFLKMYQDILAKDGQIIMKTDNQSLFEFSLVEFGSNGFVLTNVWVDFRKEIHEEDQISEYEQKFMDRGQPIYRAIWKKEGKHD